jgi:hypothetical protein
MLQYELPMNLISLEIHTEIAETIKQHK